MRRLICFALPCLLVLALIFVAGCGGGSDSGGGRGNENVIDILGTWSLSVTTTYAENWPEDVGQTKTQDITIHQDGNSFWFTLALSDPPISVQVDGTISQDGGVSFRFDSGQVAYCKWNGTATDNSMSGTFQGLYNDESAYGGNWTATRK